MISHADPRLEDLIGDLRLQPQREWAWQNFLPTVERLIRASRARDIIEIGGGRSPSFSQDQVRDLGLDYVSNDISQRELSKAPDWVGKAHFDVQTPDAATIAPFAGRFDIAFSKMVMEHVADYRRAYRNIHTILKPGGVAIAFHPVLYALPFALNRIMPERASQKLLVSFFPNRTDEGTPKFPAHYSGCVVSDKVRDTIRDMGYRDVWQIPFYGHGYYRRIPGLRDAHRWFTRQAIARDRTMLASFAFTIVRK